MVVIVSHYMLVAPRFWDQTLIVMIHTAENGSFTVGFTCHHLIILFTVSRD